MARSDVDKIIELLSQHGHRTSRKRVLDRYGWERHVSIALWLGRRRKADNLRRSEAATSCTAAPSAGPEAASRSIRR